MSVANECSTRVANECSTSVANECSTSVANECSTSVANEGLTNVEMNECRQPEREKTEYSNQVWDVKWTIPPSSYIQKKTSDTSTDIQLATYV